MASISDVLHAIKNTMSVMEDVKKVGDTLKEISTELSDHDRRLHRLEAKWETMMEFAAIQSAKTRQSIEHDDS